jgi:hypothetical protein
VRPLLASLLLLAAPGCRSSLLDPRPLDLGGLAGADAAPGPDAAPRSAMAWPMAGRDPQRSHRSPLLGPDQPARRRASSLLAPDAAGPVVDGQGRALVVTGSSVIGFAVADLAPVLRLDPLPGGLHPCSPVLSPDGLLVVGLTAARRSALAALEPPSGTERWRFELPERLTLACPDRVAADGTIHGHGSDGSASGVRFALAAAGDRLLWMQPGHGAVALAGGAAALLVTGDSPAQVVDAGSGALSATLRYPACFDVDALGRAHCVERRPGDYFIHTIGLPAGGTVWALANRGALAAGWADAADGAMVIVDGDEVVLLTAARGLITRRSRLPDGLSPLPSALAAPLIDARGRLYLMLAGAAGAAVACYDEAGALRWLAPIDPGRSLTGELVLAAAGTLLFTTCLAGGAGSCRLEAIASP